MEENIFFNLGNALASSKDEKELMRTAQIEHDKRKGRGKLIVVEDPKNGEHLLFDFSDTETDSENSQVFTVKRIFE